VKPYRTRIEDVPLEPGLREDEGWIDMQVQFLIGEHNAGAKDLVVGRTVLPPGGRHERHLHPNCDEFLVVLRGRGEIYTNTGREPSQAGDVIYTPRGNWHGFDNTSDADRSRRRATRSTTGSPPACATSSPSATSGCGQASARSAGRSASVRRPPWRCSRSTARSWAS
jgi:quercetin dioxygenase-like cupin family protein